MYQTEDDKVHIMVDLETLDTAPTAVILSIGACLVERSSLLPGQEFYTELATASQFERTQSKDTLEWWDTQPEGVKPKGDGNHIFFALGALSYWIQSLIATPIIWCKGTDFDTAILANAYAQLKQPLPWKYNNVRDYRTLAKSFPNVMRTSPVTHNALQDARDQAEHLKEISHYLPAGLR